MRADRRRAMITLIGVAAVSLVIAVSSWFGSPDPVRLNRSPSGDSSPPRRALVIAGGLVLAVVVVIFSGAAARWLAYIVAGGEVAATVGWLLVKTATERRAAVNERQVIKACTMIAGQLDVGEVPSQAMAVVAQDVPLLAPAAGAVRVGGDVALELLQLARGPGCAGLGALASGWQLCESTGMPLGPVMRQVADTLRQQGDVRDQRQAELATSRSTSRLLAGLPAVGLGMGFLVDANPLSFLSGGLVGHLCLVAAATLACAGLIWTEILAKEEP